MTRTGPSLYALMETAIASPSFPDPRKFFIHELHTSGLIWNDLQCILLEPTKQDRLNRFLETLAKKPEESFMQIFGVLMSENHIIEVSESGAEIERKQLHQVLEKSMKSPKFPDPRDYFINEFLGKAGLTWEEVKCILQQSNRKDRLRTFLETFAIKPEQSLGEVVGFFYGKGIEIQLPINAELEKKVSNFVAERETPQEIYPMELSQWAKIEKALTSENIHFQELVKKLVFKMILEESTIQIFNLHPRPLNVVIRAVENLESAKIEELLRVMWGMGYELAAQELEAVTHVRSQVAILMEVKKCCEEAFKSVNLGKLALKLHNKGVLSEEDTEYINCLNAFIVLVLELEPGNVAKALKTMREMRYETAAQNLEKAISDKYWKDFLDEDLKVVFKDANITELSEKLKELEVFGEGAVKRICAIDGDQQNKIEEFITLAAGVDRQKIPTLIQGIGAAQRDAAELLEIRLNLCWDRIGIVFGSVPDFIKAKMISQRGLRILCLDGGGVRGMIEATILAEIEDRVKKPIHEMFDIICGTSTGGILAIALGILKMSAVQCQELYEELAERIFPPTSAIWKNIKLYILRGEMYNKNELMKVLMEKCGDQKMEMADITEPMVFTVAAKENGLFYRTHLFCNYASMCNRLAVEHSPPGRPAWEAGVATASAPTFFNKLEIEGEDFVDGGLVANNPIKLAITEALEKLRRPTLGDSDLLVSLGTGLSRRSPDPLKRPQIPAIELFLLKDKLVNVATDPERPHEEIFDDLHHPLKLDENYFRINPQCEDIPLDASGPETMRRLKAIALNWAKLTTEGNKTLAKLCNKLH